MSGHFLSIFKGEADPFQRPNIPRRILLDRCAARNVSNQTQNIAFQRTVILIKQDEFLVQPDPENALEKIDDVRIT